MDVLVAAPYMTRFRCLGGECEDTCCAGWEIAISPEDRARLASAIGPAADALLRQIPDGQGGTLVVIGKRPEDGKCTQLDPKGWCSLHAKYGEDVLPGICCDYPRSVSRVGAQFELTGRLSCPEVARQCLLGDDTEALVPAAAAAFGRRKVDLEATVDGEVPYLTPFLQVREALITATRDRSVPVAGRLYAIAAFAERVAAYRRDAKTLDTKALTAELAELRRPERVAELAAAFAGLPVDGEALTVVMGMIHLRWSATAAFARVVTKVAKHTGDQVGVPDPGDPWRHLLAIGAKRIWQAHIAARKALSPLQTERLERYFENYAANFWLQDWYPLSPSLLQHSLQLFLRIALVRYLLLGHPDFTPTADAAQLDRAAVEVFYAATRAHDHNEAVRHVLANTLGSRKMVDLSHAAKLLKL